MSGALRERSPGPASMPPRMLRIEYQGQPYDWFNLDEMGDIVRTTDFANTLRENITHYFGVPFERQAIYDEEGILSSMIDFSRALRSVRPWLRVYDAREMVPELKDKTTKQLQEILAEVTRSHRSLTGSTFGPLGASGPGAGMAQVQNGYMSPPREPREKRDPSLSLADAVMNAASETGAPGPSSQFSAPKLLQPTAFPWGTGELQARGISPRYSTPPPQSFHQSLGSQIPGVMPPAASQIPGVMPSQARSGASAWGSRSVPAPMAPPLSQGQAGQGHHSLYGPMAQQQIPPAYGGGAALSGLPPYAAGSSWSGAPGNAGSYAAPQEVFRQSSVPGNMMGGTPPYPGAAAREALAPMVPRGMPGDTAGQLSRPPSQRDLQVQSAPAAQAMETNRIEVVLQKEPGFERFGFANVPTQDSRALVVSWVDSNGLLEKKWNRHHAGQEVNEGDHIISVNGKNDDVEAMRDQLQQTSVKLIIQRVPKSAA